MSTKPLVLVTGATGHIGFATLLALLKTNTYRARISSRKLSSAQSLASHPLLAPYANDLEFVEVPDFLAPDAFDAAVRGVSYILHMASPIPILDDSAGGSVQEVYLNPAIKGTTGIMASAMKSPSVTRIVITSSVVILAPKTPGARMGPSDLGPVPDPATVPSDNPMLAYRASKLLAHEASVKFMAEHHPAFDLVHVLPTYVQGANRLVTAAGDVHNGSNDVLLDTVLGKVGATPRFANTVLVDDVAAVEIAALDPTKAHDGDHFIAAYPDGFQWNDVLPIAKRLFPDAVTKGILPVNGSQESIPVSYDASETTRKLGVKFSGLEAQVESLVGQYVELASK